MTRPHFIEPQLATITDDVDEGDWLFERKLDGVRIIAVRDGARVKLFSRGRDDRTSTYPEIAEALAATSATRFVLDAEVVAFDGNLTSFNLLQRRSAIRDPDEARSSGIQVYLYIFDLLHLDGDDVVTHPLRHRKFLLRERIDFTDPLRFCVHRNGGNASELLADACARGAEGLIAKRADHPYRPGRSRDWLKLKCVAQQELVIGGFTEPPGGRSGLGTLLVGYHEQRASAAPLVYAGRVGTGFDTQTLCALRRQLGEAERDNPPFHDAPGDAGTHWVEPEFVCEVGFTEWNTAGHLSDPRYLGLRDDKDATDVVREMPTTLLT